MTKLDNYSVVCQIGKGACGAVYLVRKNDTKKLYALKKVQLDERRKTRTKAAVQREANILSELKHPHIVSFHESFFDENDEHLCIIQDYCDGGTLEDRMQDASLKKERLSEKTIMDLFLQMALAVRYMHSKKVLHRDLKASNVFLNKACSLCKIGDFGIAKSLDTTIEVASTCVGTPCYLSPEMCQDIPYSSKADIWALGCMLYEMVALQPAFDANNLVSLFYKIVKAEFDPIPDVYSNDLKDLLALILVKSPDERPSGRGLLRIPFVREQLLQFIAEKEDMLEQIRLPSRQGCRPYSTPNLQRSPFVELPVGSRSDTDVVQKRALSCRPVMVVHKEPSHIASAKPGRSGRVSTIPEEAEDMEVDKKLAETPEIEKKSFTNTTETSGERVRHKSDPLVNDNCTKPDIKEESRIVKKSKDIKESNSSESEQDSPKHRSSKNKSKHKDKNSPKHSPKEVVKNVLELERVSPVEDNQCEIDKVKLGENAERRSSLKDKERLERRGSAGKSHPLLSKEMRSQSDSPSTMSRKVLKLDLAGVTEGRSSPWSGLENDSYTPRKVRIQEPMRTPRVEAPKTLLVEKEPPPRRKNDVGKNAYTTSLKMSGSSKNVDSQQNKGQSGNKSDTVQSIKISEQNKSVSKSENSQGYKTSGKGSDNSAGKNSSTNKVESSHGGKGSKISDSSHTKSNTSVKLDQSTTNKINANANRILDSLTPAARKLHPESKSSKQQQQQQQQPQQQQQQQSSQQSHQRQQKSVGTNDKKSSGKSRRKNGSGHRKQMEMASGDQLKSCASHHSISSDHVDYYSDDFDESGASLCTDSDDDIPEELPGQNTEHRRYTYTQTFEIDDCLEIVTEVSSVHTVPETVSHVSEIPEIEEELPDGQVAEDDDSYFTDVEEEIAEDLDEMVMVARQACDDLEAEGNDEVVIAADNRPNTSHLLRSQCLDALGTERYEKVQKYCENNAEPELRKLEKMVGKEHSKTIYLMTEISCHKKLGHS